MVGMHQENKPKILCVDDERLNLRLLKGLLVTAGYAFQSAEDGKTALNQVAQDLPDLILLDITMPNMSGFEVLQKLRSDEKTRLIPVVMVTALKETEDRIKSLEAGCDDFISKPFDKTELLARIRSLLEISYYRSQLDEKKKFEYVMENILSGLMILSPEFRIIRFNQRAQELWGFPIDEPDLVIFLQKKFRLDYPGDLRNDLLAGSLSFEAERIETEKERPLILGVGTSVIRNPTGKIADIVFLMQDITEKKRREFQEKDFLSLISHKLQTPLTTIIDSVALLREGFVGSLNKDQTETLDVVIQKAWELNRSFEKLIGFVVTNEREKIPVSGKVHLNEYMKALAKKIEKAEVASGLALQIHCPEELEIETDEFAFSLILKNLLENAIKFNSKARKEIFLEAESSDSGISIKVRDNGDGIPGEDLERIFDVFYQVDKHRTGNVPGYGIGLAIVRRLVQGLGYSIRVESEIGKGSIFILTLPELRRS